MLLFTSPHGIDHVEHSRPSAAYVAMLATGLHESRGWDDDQVIAYVDRVVPGGWTASYPRASYSSTLSSSPAPERP